MINKIRYVKISNIIIFKLKLYVTCFQMCINNHDHLLRFLYESYPQSKSGEPNNIVKVFK